MSLQERTTEIRHCMYNNSVIKVLTAEKLFSLYVGNQILNHVAIFMNISIFDILEQFPFRC